MTPTALVLFVACSQADRSDLPGAATTARIHEHYRKWYRDVDGDLHGNPDVWTRGLTRPDGYRANATDCNDSDADIHPGATEVCGRIDEDCDGLVDARDPSAVLPLWYADADGDGYGDQAMSTRACSQPSGYAAEAGDCDDADAAISPGAFDACCDGVDDDCDGYADNSEYAVSDASLKIVAEEAELEAIASGDFDADGVADLAVGCPGCEGYWGEVYLVYGPASGTVHVRDAVAISTSSMEDRYYDLFGAVLVGGDADGDALDDLLVGTQGAYNTAEAEDGAYVFRGPLTAAMTRGDADAYLEVPGWAYMRGALVPDTTGDGVADYGIGRLYTLDDATDDGRVYVVSGSVSGSVDIESVATYVYDPDSSGDQLGLAPLVDIGDPNGDGIAELAISARSAEAGGVVYIVEGGAPAGTYPIGTAASATLVNPPIEGALYGDDLAAADFDGDGADDLVVGATGARNAEGIDSGAAYLHLGPFSGVTEPEDAHASWYSDVSNYVGGVVEAGDLDGDATPDVVLQAIKSDARPYALFLQLGPASGAIQIETLRAVVGNEEERLYWTGPAFVPDWNGDARLELAVPIQYDRDADTDLVGGVYVLGSTVFD